MSLSREDYNAITHILNNRKSLAEENALRRKEELYNKIPELESIDNDLAELNLEELKSRIGKSKAADSHNYREKRAKLIKLKADLLEKAGYPIDYTDIHYHCEKCKDSGFIGNKECSCYKTLVSEILNDRSGLPRLSKEVKLADIDLSIYDDSDVIENINYTQKELIEENVLPKLRDFIETIDEGKAANLFFTGPVGTGKTYLSAVIAGELIDRQKMVYYEKAELIGRFIKEREFGREEKEDAIRKLDLINKAELLIIDDLGTELKTSITSAGISAIIADRLDSNLSTIISTNLSLNEVGNIYDQRISSRIMGNYVLVPVYGSDLRRKKRNEL